MNVWKPGAFSGHTRSLEIAGALLSEVRHTSPRRVAPHSHEAPYFSLLLEGSYAEQAADFAVRYEPYTVVFHQALTEHSDEIAAVGCRMFFVELFSPWNGLAAANARRHLFEMDGSAPVWLMLQLYREFHARDAASPLSVESALFELCEYLTASMLDLGAEPPWVAQTEELLRAQLSDRVDLRAVARQMSVNPSHLCRTFRRFRHTTIGHYVMGLRIQSVCRKLVEGHATLSEVAQQAGFTDQSHMTRVFKRFTGSSPGAYRRDQGAKSQVSA